MTTTPESTGDVSTQDVVAELRDAKWLMMTTATEDGKLVSHPMVPQQVADTGATTFFLSADSGQEDALTAGSQVNLAISGKGRWVSISGTIEFEDNQELFDELWNDSVAGWFGAEGKSGARLVTVTPHSAQAWGVSNKQPIATVEF